jgi:drug/metabolite transporter (DMT)-like permease
MQTIFIIIISDVLAQLCFKNSITKKRIEYMVVGMALYLVLGLGNYFLMKQEKFLSTTMILYGCESIVILLIYLYSQFVLKEKYTTTEWIGIGLGVASIIVLLLGKNGYGKKK